MKKVLLTRVLELFVREGLLPTQTGPGEDVFATLEKLGLITTVADELTDQGERPLVPTTKGVDLARRLGNVMKERK
jgi:hypothetical protein